MAAPLLIMQSNGGVAAPPEVSRRAALSLLSGPAAGPTAGLWHLAPHDLHDCITIDMGGRHVAPVFSTMNMAGNLGAMLFPLAVPWFVRGAGWDGGAEQHWGGGDHRWRN